MTGFSYATVARALSGTGYCGAEAKKKILEAAEAINYQSNASARNLRNGKTEKILFCIPDICNAFYFRMIQGATDELAKYGYYVMIFGTDGKRSKEAKALELLKQKHVDGLVMVSFDFSEDNISAVRDSDRPVVLTNRFEHQKNNDNFDYVYADHIKGMESATDYLVSKGCRKILLLTGNKDEQTSRERTSGYISALEKKRIEVNADYIVDGGFAIEGGYRAFEKVLDKGLEYDGIITANDLMLMGVARHLSGSKSWQKSKIVSFDNTDFAANLGITSVDLKQDKIGETAICLLMERLVGGRQEASNVYIEPELIIRK